MFEEFLGMVVQIQHTWFELSQVMHQTMSTAPFWPTVPSMVQWQGTVVLQLALSIIVIATFLSV
jgi:hypothetical protein